MAGTAAALQTAIAALETQRAILGSSVVDAALAPLLRELERLRTQHDAVPSSHQLKQVSVLFIDVVGSTAIGQRLAPEEIHAVMDTALEQFTAVVRTHHGRVLQYTGDGMLAAFGTETASEDDAEWAVRAGLAVIEAAREHATTVLREFGIADFNIRAGIHTGRVLLGAGVDAEGSIRGGTVNIAARMEQTAPHGRLRISHDTWRLVRGLFETSELEPVPVKGVDQPVRSYLVERAASYTFRNPTRGIEGIAARMVGRDAELNVLREAIAKAALESRLAAVTVVGEPGIGKSRLLAEFRQHLEDTDQPCSLLLARAHPRSALHPYSQLRDLLAWELGLADSDTPEVAREKFVRRFATLIASDGDALLHALGHLIGLDFSESPHLQELLSDEEALRDRAFEAASLVLRRIAESRPGTIVVVFDDLHWIDDGSLAFARYVLERNRDMRLLCVFLCRPSLFDRLPGWADGDPLHRRIDLRALDEAGSRELSEALLIRLETVPDALRAIVTDRAEGNPFYMEELVKMLIDDGVIVVDSHGWNVQSDRLLGLQVPSTLTGVLQARLDGLPAREREALRQASIVGHVFWDRALAAVDADAMDALPSLLERQLVVQRADRPGENSGEYAFQHHLLHQVTYDGVLKESRRLGHARAGAFWSARAQVGSPREVNPSTCRALAEALDHRRRADPKACTDWFDGQFTHYLGAYVGGALRPLAQSVLELCEQCHGAESVETARSLTNLARMELQQRQIAGAEPLLQRALSIQERSLGVDHPDTARTVAALGGYHVARGDHGTAEAFFRRSLGIRERILGPEHVLTLSTLDLLAAALTEVGRLDEAEPLFREVLGVRTRTLGPEDPATAQAITALAEVRAKRGDLAGAEELLRRALVVQERVLGTDHPDLGLTLWHLTEILRRGGRLEEAEPLAKQALEIFETTFGDAHEWTAWGLASLAELRLAQGRATEAESLAARAQATFERPFGTQHAQVVAMLVVRARCALDGGEFGRAASMLQEALAIEPSPRGLDTTRQYIQTLLAQARERAS